MIARCLRPETTVGKRWIAQQLAMESVSNVTYCLKTCAEQQGLLIMA